MNEILLQALSDVQNSQNTCELFSRVSAIMPVNADDYKIVIVQPGT